jgi:hypothetical protein
LPSPMKPVKKILVGSLILIFIMVASLSGILLYFLSNPQRLKPFLEDTISGSTGTLFTMEALSYSLKPLKIESKGITVAPGKSQKGFHLKIAELSADMALEGSFGHKVLVFRDLKMEGVFFQLSRDMRLPEVRQKKENPSYMKLILKRMVALFLFQDIRFQAAEMRAGEMDVQLQDQTLRVKEIRARVHPDRLMEITCRAQMTWPSRNANLTLPFIRIVTDKAISLAHPEVKGVLTIEKGSLKGPDATVGRFDLTTTLDYLHGEGRLLINRLVLDLASIMLPRNPETSVPARQIHIEARGSLDLGHENLKIDAFRVTGDDILETQGSFSGRVGAETNLELHILDGQLRPDKALNYLPGEVRGRLADIRVSGPVHFRGEISGRNQRKSWHWNCDFKTFFDHNDYAIKAEQVSLCGFVSGSVQIEGNSPDLTLSGHLKTQDTRLLNVGVHLKPFEAEISFSGGHPVLQIGDLKANIPQAMVDLRGEKIPFDGIKLHLMNARMDMAQKSLKFPVILLDTAQLKDMRMRLEGDERQASFKLEGRNANLIALAHRLRLLPAGWQIQGQEAFILEVTLNNKKNLSFHTNITISGLSIQNKNATLTGEGIALKCEITGETDLEDHDTRASGNLSVDKGEVLLDRFYLDMKQNPLKSSLQGTYDPLKRNVHLRKVDLSIKDIIHKPLNADLKWSPQDRRMELLLDVPPTPVQPVFRYFLLEPFKTEKPILQKIHVLGNINAHFRFQGERGLWQIKGRSTLRKGRLDYDNGRVSLQGIDLDLPIWYCSREKDSGTEKELSGSLSIKNMILPELPEQPLSISFHAEPNGLAIKSPTILRIPGGDALFGPVACKGLFHGMPTLSTRLTLNQVKLGPLLSVLWSHPVQGTIDGKLDPIVFKEGRIKSQGILRSEIFGGEMVFSRIGASGIFTPAPVFRLNAQWQDLNLEEITGHTTFGKIQGLLDGNVKDLEIAYGQPQRFDLLMETEEKRGIPQRISVKAVDSIGRIGGGQSPFLGAAGIVASLFKEFPYKKIGIHAKLRNDIFQVNGTIKEDGREYMIKRSGFSGVNVVNQNPDNRIGFKDMVKRIKRVTAPGSSPIVK